MIRAAARLIPLLIASISLLAQPPALTEHACQPAIPNARCGFVQVLEDHANPSSRRLNLEFIQVRSTSSERDPAPWIDIAGGPGEADTPAAHDLLPVFDYVLKHRDIVVYDQRGTGASSPLHCDPHDAITKPEQAGDFLPDNGVRRCWQQLSLTADLAKTTQCKACRTWSNFAPRSATTSWCCTPSPMAHD